MSKASRLKGHCNPLVAIFELSGHQRFGCLRMVESGLFDRRFGVVRASAIIGLVLTGLCAAMPATAENVRPETLSVAEKQSQDTAGCGATIDDNLAAARQSLGANDAASRAALACLIEATAALNARVRNFDEGRSASGKLRAPIYNGTIKIETAR